MSDCAKCEEYRREALRLRNIVRRMMDGLDTNGVAVEVYDMENGKGGIGIFICAPTLNEGNLGEAATIVIKELFSATGRDPDKVNLTNTRVTGTEGDK